MFHMFVPGGRYFCSRFLFQGPDIFVPGFCSRGQIFLFQMFVPDARTKHMGPLGPNGLALCMESWTPWQGLWVMYCFSLMMSICLPHVPSVGGAHWPTSTHPPHKTTPPPTRPTKHYATHHYTNITAAVRLIRSFFYLWRQSSPIPELRQSLPELTQTSQSSPKAPPDPPTPLPELCSAFSQSRPAKRVLRNLSKLPASQPASPASPASTADSPGRPNEF